MKSEESSIFKRLKSKLEKKNNEFYKHLNDELDKKCSEKKSEIKNLLLDKSKEVSSFINDNFNKINVLTKRNEENYKEISLEYKI